PSRSTGHTSSTRIPVLSSLFQPRYSAAQFWAFIFPIVLLVFLVSFGICSDKIFHNVNYILHPLVHSAYILRMLFHRDTKPSLQIKIHNKIAFPLGKEEHYSTKERPYLRIPPKSHFFKGGLLFDIIPPPSKRHIRMSEKLINSPVKHWCEFEFISKTVKNPNIHIKGNYSYYSAYWDQGFERCVVRYLHDKPSTPDKPIDQLYIGNFVCFGAECVIMMGGNQLHRTD